MANRKLQGEIERTLKKVQEGLELFHDTLDKLNSTTTPNQKEKVEGDLKKEIKKLQRLRDQIKGWQQLSEIKDKGQLNEARRSIETEMERFKVLEKEMKIKAFSKEGLNQAAKLDPKERERQELVGWLSETVDRLNTGLDAYEAEMESLRIGAKKGKKLESSKQSRLQALQLLSDRHRHHIKKLELIRRLLENERLGVDDIRALQDDVNYYLDEHQEPDFVENEEMYDELDLATSASDSDEDGDDGSGSEDEAPRPKTPVVPAKQQTVPSIKPSVNVAPVQPVQPVKAASTITVVPLAQGPKPVAPVAQAKITGLTGPSFASALNNATPSNTASAPSTPTTTTTPTTPATAPLSFAAAAKPTSEQQAASHKPAAGYEELLAHLAGARRSQKSRTDLMAALTSSYQNCPDGFEAESGRPYLPRNPVSSPPPDYYPTASPSILENPAIFERLDLDTLFFIFYYQQKTYAQYLAARELKRQSWRFHKKYLTWFQRHEEPKSITDEYEQGTYIYFDYESSWCQRKKTEFTFEYRYLEDEETV